MNHAKLALVCALAASTAACATMDPMPARIATMNCDQLETALAYESDARRENRRLAGATGLASILADDDDFDDVSLDSDIHSLDADNNDRHIEQIEQRMAAQCS